MIVIATQEMMLPSKSPAIVVDQNNQRAISAAASSRFDAAGNDQRRRAQSTIVRIVASMRSLVRKRQRQERRKDQRLPNPVPFFECRDRFSGNGGGVSAISQQQDQKEPARRHADILFVIAKGMKPRKARANNISDSGIELSRK